MCLNKSKKHGKKIKDKKLKVSKKMNFGNNVNSSPLSPDSIKEESDDSIVDGTEYICKECNRQFLHKRNLILHRKMHKALNIYKDHKNCLYESDQRNDFLLEVAKLVQKITTDPDFDQVLHETTMLLRRESHEKSYMDLNHQGKISDLSNPNLLECQDENLIQWAKQCMEKQPKVVLKRLDSENGNGEGPSTYVTPKQEYTPSHQNYQQHWNQGFNYYPSSSENVVTSDMEGSDVSSSEMAKKRMRKHPCKDCGKVFTSIDNLKIHMRIHKGDKPYECKECGKRFRQRCHINNHMLIHQGIKPWKCKVCGEDFRQVANLLKHQQKH